MKDNKGMTLIEVVVSLLILSTASLIMVMGFTTAIHTFSDANSYKNAVNEIKSALVKDQVSNTRVSIDDKSTKYVITENEGSTPIEVKGTLNKANSEVEDKVTLSSFKKGKSDDTRKAYKVYNNYLKMMKEMETYINSHYKMGTVLINNSRVTKAVNEWLRNEKNIQYDVVTHDVITDLPKIYAVLYPNVEDDSVVEKINSVNLNYDKTNSHYVVPYLYMENMEYTRFFLQKAYENVIITMSDYNTEVPPTSIYAVYKYDSGDTDEWYIAKEGISSTDLQNIIKEDVNNNTPLVKLNTTLNNNPNWELYKTTKE